MATIPAASGMALAIYVMLGAVIGVIASGVSKSVYLLEDTFEKLPIHWMWWPAIGAIAVGIIGYFAPNTLGVGYANISGLLTGALPLNILLTLCILKYISWVVALSSGTSGGTLAPLFTIGGATGALLGTLVLQLFPGCGINIATAALIGMAAMFAGASRALLTSIVFLLETTAQHNGLLPLIGACTAAYFVSFFLMKGSIMTEKIQRRGIRTPDSYKPDVLQGIGAGEIMDESPVLICADNNITDLKKWVPDNITSCQYNYFIVADENENFVGYIERNTLLASAEDETPYSIQNIMVKNLPVAYERQDLAAISMLMGANNMQVIAVVVYEAGNLKVTGVVTSDDIIQAYSNHHKKESDYHVAISLKRRTGKLMIKGRLLIQSKFAREEI
jgi:predicted transcriptional regulator